MVGVADGGEQGRDSWVCMRTAKPYRGFTRINTHSNSFGRTRNIVVLGAIFWWGCSAHYRPHKQVFVYPPGHCVEVVGFAKPCLPAKSGQGYTCDGVSIRIKPDPECNEWNGQNMISVR